MQYERFTNHFYSPIFSAEFSFTCRRFKSNMVNLYMYRYKYTIRNMLLFVGFYGAMKT